MNNLDKWKKMTDLYRKDERVRDFILNFFQTRKGIRCACFQDGTRGIYWRFGWNEQKALTGIDIENFWRRIGAAKGLAIFFYTYIFDDIVTDPGIYHWEYEKNNKGEYILKADGSKKVIILHDYDVIGGNIAFDIDIPHIKGVNRKNDFFNKKWYEEIMWVKCRVEQIFDRMGVKYNCIFSGNGIYLVTESTFFDELKSQGLDMDLSKFKRTSVNMREKMQPFPGGGHPVIDLRDIGWATYLKIPWTFHESRNRMSIPISKGYIYRNWLQTVTNLNEKYTLSKANIDDILERCKWVNNIW